MNPEIEQILEKRFRELPEIVVEAIKSVHWIEVTQSIGQDSLLNPKQLESFELETALVVLGIELPMHYPGNLQRELGVDETTVIKLAKGVDTQIIAPIEESLERLQKEASQENIKNTTTVQSALPTETAIPSNIEFPPIILPTSTTIATSASILPTVESKNTSLEVSPNTLPSIKTAPTDMAPVQTPSVPAAPQTPKSIVEEKLTQVTVSSAPAAKQPVPSYNTGQDPYREPVE